jgi:hypothetical protein
MGAVEKLKSYIDADDRYAVPHAEVAELQLEAARELFHERRQSIKFLGHRATEAGVTDIRTPADLVGLLFAHTTYKSYPEGWLTDQKWPMLSKWVDTMSTHRVQGVDFAGITDIDDWINRLAAAGHYLSCSSGTTGKSAMLNASAADMEWAKKNAIASAAWGAGVQPRNQFRQFGMAAIPAVPRNLITRDAMTAAFNIANEAPFAYPVPPITLGQVTGMVALRKRIADGVAEPSEIAGFEATSKERAAAVEAAVGITAEALIAARQDPLYLSGMWGTIYKVAEAVRAKGFSGKDFNPENILFVAGGLKGAVLPPNYREYVYETFNLAPERTAQNYSMQEIATAMPRCRAGRYHLPPWLMCLLLDEPGENLIPAVEADGEVEGRAGFFDISLDGRWNGVISGDKISISYKPCACGSHSPSIRDNITRYADLPGGDKITCAGSVDAYVRGVA